MVVEGREKQEENDRHTVSGLLSYGPSFPSEDLAVFPLGRTGQALWQRHLEPEQAARPLSSRPKKGTYLLRTSSCAQCTSHTGPARPSPRRFGQALRSRSSRC